MGPVRCNALVTRSQSCQAHWRFCLSMLCSRVVVQTDRLRKVERERERVWAVFHSTIRDRRRIPSCALPLCACLAPYHLSAHYGMSAPLLRNRHGPHGHQLLAGTFVGISKYRNLDFGAKFCPQLAPGSYSSSRELNFSSRELNLGSRELIVGKIWFQHQDFYILRFLLSRRPRGSILFVPRPRRN